MRPCGFGDINCPLTASLAPVTDTVQPHGIALIPECLTVGRHHIYRRQLGLTAKTNLFTVILYNTLLTMSDCLTLISQLKQSTSYCLTFRCQISISSHGIVWPSVPSLPFHTERSCQTPTTSNRHQQILGWQLVIVVYQHVTSPGYTNHICGEVINPPGNPPPLSSPTRGLVQDGLHQFRLF